MNENQADKFVKVGEGPKFAEAAFGTYYVNKEGVKFTTAKEAGDGYDARAEVLVMITIPANLTDTGDEVRDLACEHSFTRKLQEWGQKIRKDNLDFSVEAEKFPAHYVQVMKGERERKAAEVKDTAVSVALGKVATVLRKKNEAGTIGQAKTPVPNAATPPLDKAGKINYRAWAKELQAAGHPWYGTAYKEATAEKGYE